MLSLRGGNQRRKEEPGGREEADKVVGAKGAFSAFLGKLKPDFSRFS